MNADQEYYAEPRRTNRLYRDPQRGMIFGVCAGLAEYFGFDIKVTRVLTVMAAVFGMPVVFISYLVLGVMLPRKPDTGSAASYDPVQRQVRSDPHDMLSSVRYRFRDLDSRLQRLEKYVTSSRFDLDSEFRRLKD
jgi:phage shock protein C